MKRSTLLGVGLLATSLVLFGCGSDKTANAPTTTNGTVTIKIGASPVPHAEILNAVKDKLEKEGVHLDIVEFTDYIQPNLALNDKELDANFFQHKPYLDNFNKEHNLKLVSIGTVQIEPMGVYSSHIHNLNELTDGAKVAIPNDPTNGGRALLLLQSQGLIKLNDSAGILASVADITSNPKHLQFAELEAAQLPRSLGDVSIAVINTNYAIEAKLNPEKDALALESKDSPYANIVVVREGDENRPEMKKLMDALHSDEVKTFIQDKYHGAILPAF